MLIYPLLGQSVCFTVFKDHSFTNGIFTECLYVRNSLNSGGTKVSKQAKTSAF